MYIPPPRTAVVNRQPGRRMSAAPALCQHGTLCTASGVVQGRLESSPLAVSTSEITGPEWRPEGTSGISSGGGIAPAEAD